MEKLQVENVDIDDVKDNLEELAKNEMSRRQICSAITTAQQYAEWKGKKLNFALLKDVIETAGRFGAYIEKMNGPAG